MSDSTLSRPVKRIEALENKESKSPILARVCPWRKKPLPGRVCNYSLHSPCIFYISVSQILADRLFFDINCCNIKYFEIFRHYYCHSS
jgi:hypothetical protein